MRYLTNSVLTLIVLAFLNSCSFPKGYAVLLWSPDEIHFPSGSVMSIKSESKIKKRYTLQKKSYPTPLIIPTWKAAFFKSKKKANVFSKHYQKFAPITAKATHIGLPIRKKMDNLSPIVYRLGDGEIIKVLNRSEKEVNLSGFKDYWYYVLTIDGTKGWAFGYYLKILNPNIITNINQRKSDIRSLINMHPVWYPEYFYTMVRDHQIDLSRFKETYGFFPYPKEHYFLLRLPKIEKSFPYEALINLGENRIGTPDLRLELELLGKNKLSVFFIEDGKTQRRIFSGVAINVKELTEREIKRRNAQFKDLLDLGEIFENTYYGILKIADDQSFLWTGYNQLTPTLIKEKAGNVGTIAFNVFPSKDISFSQTGIITFLFQALPQHVYFMYQLTKKGVRLTYLPAHLIKDKILTALPTHPFIIFFYSKIQEVSP